MADNAEVLAGGSGLTPWSVRVTLPERQPAGADCGMGNVEHVLPDGITDAELVQAVLSGSAEAFDIIVRRHRKGIYQLCYRYVGRHEDANDLTQDVFLRAFRGLKRFKGRSSLTTWLYRIGVNVCLNHVTSKTVRLDQAATLQAAEPIDAGAESPADAVLREERAQRVRDAIAQLPPKQRATLVLRVYQDLSHEEIARVLGTSVGACKANLFHALSKLKVLLQP
jgi:RNA polymerase sigma-70 factor (ECF subfamily)